MVVSSASVCLVYTGNLRHMLGNRHVFAHRRPAIPSCETNFSDMGVNAPKGLFPPEPKHYGGPKLIVAIIGAGLAGMSTAVELLDQGHEVDMYESRSIIGGKVGSFVDKQGNHMEMGLHVFFGCYSNLFRLLKKEPMKGGLMMELATRKIKVLEDKTYLSFRK